LDDLIVGAYQANPKGKSDAGKSDVIFGKTDSTASELSCCGSTSSTNNQIIQAIAVDITCGGD
jgi:hypothetical protein